MRYAVEQFHDDLSSWRDLTVSEVWRRVGSIPYRMDTEVDAEGEIVGRPSKILKFAALDCKKKSILIASWAQVRGIPWRFVAVDYGGGWSHVYTEVNAAGCWLAMDCTIPGLSFPGAPDGARRRLYG
jgi:hypothetical protein